MTSRVQIGCLVAVALWACVLPCVGRAGGAPHRSPCGHHGHCMCVPNVRNYGYYPTQWRRWPTELRQDEHFFESLGRERLPTPPGEPTEPLPIERLPARPLPGAEELPVPDGILPPDGPFQPETPILPEEPAFPGGIPPFMPGRIPGLPQQGGIPGLPQENGIPSLPQRDTIPGLPQRETIPGLPQPERLPESPLEPESPTPLEIPAETPLPVPPQGSLQRPREDSPMGPNPLVSYHKADLPLAFDGFCPVTLSNLEQWRQGRPEYTAVYQDRVFHMAGSDEREQFVASPHRFAPMFGGIDPVLVVDEQRWTPGSIQYSVTYKGRIFMLSSSANVERFHENPSRYAFEIDD